MKLFEVKQLLIEHARNLIPDNYRNLIDIPGNGRSRAIVIINLNSAITTHLLKQMGKESVSLQISRNETLPEMQPVESFTYNASFDDREVESFVKLSVGLYLENEKAIIKKNMAIALESPQSSLFQFLTFAQNYSGANAKRDNDPILAPNPLHDQTLTFFLDYQERNEDFVFWLRERNKANRLNEGFWFQGTETYAFVGLYNSWSGNYSTKGIGLVFWLTDRNTIGLTFEVIFKGEKRPEFLQFYKRLLSLLKAEYGDKLDGDNNSHYWIFLSDDDGFRTAEEFLNKYWRKINTLVTESDVQEILIAQKDFRKKRSVTLNIRERIRSGDKSLLKKDNKESNEDDTEGADESIMNQNPKVNSNFELQHDTPSTIDQLGRRPFVDALFQYIKRLWQTAEKEDSYTIHINGEWGSGKSTVLKLLKESLEGQRGEFRNRWIVVEFNSWQNQHMQVPWWIFLDTVYKTVLQRSRWFKKPWIFIREHWWRIVSMNVGKWITFSILAIVLIVTLSTGSGFMHLDKLFEPTNDSNSELDSNSKLGILISFLSLIGTVWLFLSGIINSLLPGSEEAAIQYKHHVRDPMKKIKEHYKDITNYTSRNIAVFIDDIDRCDPKFVVQLLEGLQTLFKTRKVLYIIAGDAMWIRQSFEIHYRDLRATITKKGQSLGNFFVEKTLQQSVNLPAITPELKRAYWNKLLNGADLNISESKYTESVNKINDAVTQKQMDEIIQRASTEEEKTVLRGKAAEKVSSKEIIKEITHELLDYHEYLAPNPRSMKRLINNLALTKASNILAGVNEKIEQDVVVRWAILRSVFPLIASEIGQDPSKLKEYQDESKNPEIAKILKNMREDSLEYLNV